MALISAHRAGAGDLGYEQNGLRAIEHSLAVGADYVELDVRVTADGEFVVSHDEPSDAPLASWVLTLDAALAALQGRGRLHLDLKLVSPADAYETPEQTLEVAVVRRSVAALGAENLIVTTLEDRAVVAVRRWAEADHPDLLVGLSLGRGRESSWWRTLRTLLSELFPGRRFRDSAPNLVVAHRRLARLTVGALARRRGLPLVVWTVDEPRALRYWLSPGRAWLVTTNVPAIAVRIRSELEGEADHRDRPDDHDHDA